MKGYIQKVVSYAVVMLIVLSLPIINPAYKKADIVENTKRKSFTLSDIQKIYPTADSYREGGDKSYDILSLDGEQIARFIVSDDFIDSNSGYSGEVNVLIGFKSSVVDGVLLLDNVESRSYVRKVVESGLLQRCDGMEMAKIPDTSLDAVSGATFTSKAVIRAIKESTGAYLSIAAKSGEISIFGVVKIVLFAFVIIASLLSAFRKGMSKYRTIYLIFLIAASGFLLQAMLSVTTFDGWVRQGVSLSSSWQTILLLVLALVMPLLGKNRYYCTFLCPMGALQELTGKISPLKKYSLKFLRFKYFSVNDIYLLLIIASMFTSLNIDLTYFEPFISFAMTIAPIGMLIFGVVIVLLSLIFNRPWCAVCPTGCALNHLSFGKPSVKK